MPDADAGARGRGAIVRFTSRVIVLAALVVIPVQILVRGFLPPDDALRHAAKAVDGRPWTEIVVLRPDMTLDAHPAWHALLGTLHRLTGADAHALVLVSVIGLFVLANLPSALLLRRPEALLLVLVVLVMADVRAFSRFLTGRPLLISMGLVSLLALVWPRLRERWDPAIASLLVASFALATAAHGSWFLFLLPLAGFFLAGEVRAGWRVLACWALGVLAGALVTGHPVGFLLQAVRHAVISTAGATRIMHTVEFEPAQGAPLVVVAAAIALSFRARERLSGTLRDPLLAIAVLGWVLGFSVRRFWTDWGAPAAVVWLALEIERALERAWPAESTRRLAAVAGIAAAAFLATTNDYELRWSSVGPSDRLATNAAHREWLPGEGGLLYSTSMQTFFSTFYGEPHARWRYVLGFEPALMTDDNLAVLSAYARTGDVTRLEPWVHEMRPSDRLLLRYAAGAPPSLHGLEWLQLQTGLWIGRLPSGASAQSGSAARRP